jgi:hypothetical protein
MLKNRALTTIAAATLAFTWAALPAAAEEDFADEVDACVAAVYRHIDVSDADRVRHYVTRTKRTGIGYVFTIDTTVYGASSERKYAASCVARGNAAPVKFRIDEIET